MPIVKSELIGEAPKGAHLAVVTGADGSAMAIPVGALMYVVLDPTRPDRVWPMELVKVTEKGLRFRCPCRKPNCTRVLRYSLTAEGHHPPSAGAVASSAE